MQRIKFRGWHKVFKQIVIIDWIQLNATKDMNIYAYAFSRYDTNLQLKVSDYATLDEIVLMQWTGLHDKNGKEMFEGDIITSNINRNHWSIPTQQTYIITWHEGKFHLNDIDGKLGWIINWHISSKVKDVEIIGNIYEHPHFIAVPASQDALTHAPA